MPTAASSRSVSSAPTSPPPRRAGPRAGPGSTSTASSSATADSADTQHGDPSTTGRRVTAVMGLLHLRAKDRPQPEQGRQDEPQPGGRGDLRPLLTLRRSLEEERPGQLGVDPGTEVHEAPLAGGQDPEDRREDQRQDEVRDQR